MPARTSKTGIEVESITQSELYGVIGRARGEAAPLDEAVIRQKLYAAEDLYERDLQIRFRPTRVFSAPEQRGAAAEAALRLTDFDPINGPQDDEHGGDLAEPAYDYPTNLWSYERWATLKLRNRPIRSMTQIIFTWAGSTKIWKVPAEWIQTDSRYGTLNIIPTTGPAVVMRFNSFLISVIAGGRGLPHSIVVDYETGFSSDELQWQHQDLLNGVRLRTLLLLGGIISNITGGGAQSLSLAMDGLSRSRGFAGKYGPYSGALQLAVEQEEEIRDRWRVKEKGPQFTIL